MTKPFGPRELVARLEAVLRRAQPEGAEPKIVAEGIEIDLAARSSAATARRSTDPDRVWAAARAGSQPGG